MLLFPVDRVLWFVGISKWESEVGRLSLASLMVSGSLKQLRDSAEVSTGFEPAASTLKVDVVNRSNRLP